MNPTFPNGPTGTLIRLALRNPGVALADEHLRELVPREPLEELEHPVARTPLAHARNGLDDADGPYF